MCVCPCVCMSVFAQVCPSVYVYEQLCVCYNVSLRASPLTLAEAIPGDEM